MPTRARAPPCKRFARGGFCRYGDACRFSHDACATSDAPRSRARARRRRRASHEKVRAFTDWLRETFDLRDARVVDVAGGKGTLAYDVLQRTEAAEVCVIDPRRMRRGRLRRRWRDRLDESGGAPRRRPARARASRARGREVREPKHVRVYFTRAVWEGDEASVRASYELARKSRWCVKGLVADGADRTPTARTKPRASRSRTTRLRADTRWNHQRSNEDDDEDDDKHGDTSTTTTTSKSFPIVSAEVRPALLDARAMHARRRHAPRLPSSDVVIEFAIERRLPFAIVPCCVYGGAIDRHAGAGRGPRTDLVDHLIERAFAVDVHARELPFPGKNIVVYGTGARQVDACAPCLDRLRVSRAGPRFPARSCTIDESRPITPETSLGLDARDDRRRRRRRSRRRTTTCLEARRSRARRLRRWIPTRVAMRPTRARRRRRRSLERERVGARPRLFLARARPPTPRPRTTRSTPTADVAAKVCENCPWRCGARVDVDDDDERGDDEDVAAADATAGEAIGEVMPFMTGEEFSARRGCDHRELSVDGDRARWRRCAARRRARRGGRGRNQGTAVADRDRLKNAARSGRGV